MAHDPARVDREHRRDPGAAAPGPDVLAGVLARTRDADEAAAVVVAHLADGAGQGHLLPRVYLERRGTLRCVAGRRAEQILDGLEDRCGLVGRTWVDGVTLVARDLATDPRCPEAPPGILATLCVPVDVDGVCRGVVEVASPTVLPEHLRPDVERCAALLGSRLGQLGFRGDGDPWDRLAAATADLSVILPGPDAVHPLARILLAGGPPVRAVAGTGPLAGTVAALPDDELAALVAVVDAARSCVVEDGARYGASPGIDTLLEHGARIVVVLPLRARGTRVGTAVLAHTRRTTPDRATVRSLEILAGHAASLLAPTLGALSASPSHPEGAEPGDGTGGGSETDRQAAMAAALSAARARHPSAAGAPDGVLVDRSGPGRPVLTLVAASDAPQGLERPGEDPLGVTATTERPELFLERRSRHRSPTPGT
jgi:hypothetical protein